MPHTVSTPPFLFSDDPALLDLATAHAFIARSYWAKNIPRDLFDRSVANSLPFGVYQEPPGEPRTQIGFARIISDKATYAYLCDVFIHEAFRGRGLARTLIRHIIAHPDLHGIRRMALITTDAQAVYAPLGFVNMPDPRKYMEWRWKSSY